MKQPLAKWQSDGRPGTLAAMKRRTLLTVLFIIILWLATALRFYRLDAQSFWNDEGNSARLSERSTGLIIEGAASDIHPPLYYLLLGGWRQLLGESEFSLRALSAFAGVAVVATTVVLARHLFRRDRLLPVAAALFVAVNPALIYYSQEARMYELLALWTVLCTLFLLRLLADFSKPRPSSARLNAFAYILLAAAGLYTHYFFPAVLLTHNLMVAWWLVSRFWQERKRVQGTPAATTLGRTFTPRFIVYWAVIMVLTLLAYLPWAPIFWRQAGGRPGETTAAFAFLSDAVRWLALGSTVVDAARPPALIAFLGLALFGLLPLERMAAGAAGGRWRTSTPRPGSNLYLLLPLVVPVLLMLLVGTTRPAYYKFMLVAVPFLALLVAKGLVTFWRAGTFVPWLQVGLGLVAVGLSVWALYGSGSSLVNLYFDPAYARDDYRGMAATIEAEGHPNAGIILNAANQWEVFTYYHRDGAPVYPIPRGQPNPERIAGELSEIAARHDRLYALFWGEAERDPQRLVERWLDTHAFKATDRWVGNVRFVTYAVPRAPATEMETPVAVSFDNKITLLGYTLQGEQLAPGDIVQVTLFWQAEQALATRYKVFLHLLDGQGALVAQRDAEPGGDMALTTSWQPGQVVKDNHGVLVPLDASPGEYELRVGLYPLGAPQERLPVQEQGGDSFRLKSITIH